MHPRQSKPTWWKGLWKAESIKVASTFGGNTTFSFLSQPVRNCSTGKIPKNFPGNYGSKEILTCNFSNLTVVFFPPCFWCFYLRTMKLKSGQNSTDNIFLDSIWVWVPSAVPTLNFPCPYKPELWSAWYTHSYKDLPTLLIKFPPMLSSPYRLIS